MATFVIGTPPEPNFKANPVGGMVRGPNGAKVNPNPNTRVRVNPRLKTFG